MLFDLDDTLLDRDKAVDKLFSIILEEFYGDVEQHAVKTKCYRNSRDMIKKLWS